MASRPSTQAPPANRPTPEQNGVRYGFLTAAVLCAYTLLAVALGFFQRVEAGSLDVLILVLGSVLAIRNLKQHYRQEMPYLGGYGTGIIAAMVASVCLGVLFYIIIQVAGNKLELTQVENLFGSLGDSGIVATLAIILMGTMAGVITSLVAMQYFKADRADPLKMKE